jgi:hypothetical protein
MYPQMNMSEKGGSVHRINAADAVYVGRDEMLEYQIAARISALRVWSDNRVSVLADETHVASRPRLGRQDLNLDV